MSPPSAAFLAKTESSSTSPIRTVLSIVVVVLVVAVSFKVSVSFFVSLLQELIKIKPARQKLLNINFFISYKFRINRPVKKLCHLEEQQGSFPKIHRN